MSDANEITPIEKSQVEKQIELLKLQIELMNLQKDNDEETKWKRDDDARRQSQTKWLAKNPDYFKIYQAKHRDELIEKRRTTVCVKVKCSFCEKEISQGNLKRHIKLKHDNMDYLMNYIDDIKALVE
jgi:hypothetical protein